VEFVLTGFSQENNIRRYTFQALPAGNGKPVGAPKPAGNPKKEWTVSADLSLMRKHKIPLQELPLLCKRLVEAQADQAKEEALMFTERDMLGYASNRSAAELAAEVKKRARRMPSSNRVGMAWRTAPHR
jgi:effector-binding domain-containing protein